MRYQQTTPVPNSAFDTYLPQLSGAEFKLLMIIIRQTNGWMDKRTGHRKTRDRISHSQFMRKTGLSRRVISKALKHLVTAGVVTVTDARGKLLGEAEHRKGLSNLFYAFAPEKDKSQRYTSMKTIAEILQTPRYQLLN
ncbi:MAG: replication protein [Saprospiraceae bacterium]|nr:replication protein [Saprospiraceae bacterium]MCF8252449.1 replication protein [Saprospiraceae bacterium]MCF8282296.1 replication protein [Bacteroidales bacterium]MCF8314025.1 replication protein [Saprospiraceae bacterium]MCF8442779.1 replication protein [Saprospiraceae bacterium]